jgi:hypothetical protein
MSGPEDKFTNYLDTSLYSGAGAVLNALNTAWASYYATYDSYPTVVLTVGSVIYYGSYGA